MSALAAWRRQHRTAFRCLWGKGEDRCVRTGGAPARAFASCFCCTHAAGVHVSRSFAMADAPRGPRRACGGAWVVLRGVATRRRFVLPSFFHFYNYNPSSTKERDGPTSRVCYVLRPTVRSLRQHCVWRSVNSISRVTVKTRLDLHPTPSESATTCLS